MKKFHIGVACLLLGWLVEASQQSLENLSLSLKAVYEKIIDEEIALIREHLSTIKNRVEQRPQLYEGRQSLLLVLEALNKHLGSLGRPVAQLTEALDEIRELLQKWQKSLKTSISVAVTDKIEKYIRIPVQTKRTDGVGFFDKAFVDGVLDEIEKQEEAIFKEWDSAQKKKGTVEQQVKDVKAIKLFEGAKKENIGTELSIAEAFGKKEESLKNDARDISHIINLTTLFAPELAESFITILKKPDAADIKDQVTKLRKEVERYFKGVKEGAPGLLTELEGFRDRMIESSKTGKVGNVEVITIDEQEKKRMKKEAERLSASIIVYKDQAKKLIDALNQLDPINSPKMFLRGILDSAKKFNVLLLAAAVSLLSSLPQEILLTQVELVEKRAPVLHAALLLFKNHHNKAELEQGVNLFAQWLDSLSWTAQEKDQYKKERDALEKCYKFLYEDIVGSSSEKPSYSMLHNTDLASFFVAMMYLQFKKLPVPDEVVENEEEEDEEEEEIEEKE